MLQAFLQVRQQLVDRDLVLQRGEDDVDAPQPSFRREVGWVVLYLFSEQQGLVDRLGLYGVVHRSDDQPEAIG